MKKSSSRKNHNSKQQIGLPLKNTKKSMHGVRNNKTTSTVIHTESEHHQNQTTTKKNSYSTISQNGSNIHRANSCTKIKNVDNPPIKHNYSKANILKIQQSRSIRGNSGNVSNRKAVTYQNNSSKQLGEHKATNFQSGENLHQKNQKLIRENIELREQCVMLHENQIKNKQKIQALISRISEMKRKQANEQTQDSRETSGKEENDKQQNRVCRNGQCMAKKKKLEHQLYFSRLRVEQLDGQRIKWQGAKQKLKSQYQDLLSQIKQMRNQ